MRRLISTTLFQAEYYRYQDDRHIQKVKHNVQPSQGISIQQSKGESVEVNMEKNTLSAEVDYQSDELVHFDVSVHDEC